MNQANNEIERAIERIRPALNGLSATDVDWAIGVLRDDVLFYRFEVYGRQPRERRAVLVEHGVDGLARRLRELPAERKRHEIEAIRFDAILSRIDERAYALAQKRNRGETTPDAIEEALRLEKELMETVEDFKKWDAAAYRKHSDQVSEALLDLKFVVSGGKITSHRLARAARRGPRG